MVEHGRMRLFGGLWHQLGTFVPEPVGGATGTPHASQPPSTTNTEPVQ